MAVSAIKDGAFDFIEKPYDAEHLIASIEKALAAGSENSASRKARKRRSDRPHCELSPRQREVMELVADGLSNKQIALRLGISSANR